MLTGFFKRIVVAALTWEARLVLRRYRPRIAAVTGSVGKTSTKDAVYAVLSRSAYARKSEKSFNSELGIPLTILGLPNAWGSAFGWCINLLRGLRLACWRARYPEWLVLEVGADRPGDIRRAAKWLPADLVVITRLPEVPVHVEFFESSEAVVEEKAQLLNALKPGGTLILYGDDDRSRSLAARTKERVITFGFDEEAEVRGEAPAFLLEEGRTPEEGWPIGMGAQVRIGAHAVPLSLVGAAGKHALLPLLAGAAAGHALEQSMQQILEGLKSYEPPRGRMRLLEGIKQTLIIDDTYNSSPAAALAALETLGAVHPRGRRVAVLGDMGELGRFSIGEHRKVGAAAAEAADLLVTVGFRARGIAEGALDNGMKDSAILQHEDARKAGEELQNLLEAGDCILVKGSQSMRMERVVEEVMVNPERAADLLVRQEPEWKKR